MADSDREPLDMLAEEFAERFRRGETPTVSEYVERYPHWADQLRELLPPVAHMERLKCLKQAVRADGPTGPPLKQLGDYRILREVGRGGMGVVYEAVQQSRGRPRGHSGVDQRPGGLARGTCGVGPAGVAARAVPEPGGDLDAPGRDGVGRRGSPRGRAVR